MNGNLEKYFKKDMEGYYLDKESNEYKLKGVNCSYDRTRNEKAAKQASLESVPLGQVFSYINEFLELIREDNGFEEKNARLEIIKLDDAEHVIMDNGIIIRDNNWFYPPHWNTKSRLMTYMIKNMMI